jgi:hypothetical protein
MISLPLRAILLAFLLAPLLTTGEDKAAPAAGAAKKRQLTAAELRDFYTNPVGRIDTEWAETEQDTKIWRSFTNAGYATVLSEGKVEDGRMVFRKGYKNASDVYPDAQRPMWYTYNGIEPQFFDEQNRKLLKEGYTLMQMQRFTDEEGGTRFCAIWVKFMPGPVKK